MVLFVLSKHIIQMANWVCSVFLLKAATLPSVLGFCVQCTDNCKADCFFSGGEAQLWAVLQPSWLGLPCNRVHVVMCACSCNQNSSPTREDLLMELPSEEARRVSAFCDKSIPKYP